MADAGIFLIQDSGNIVRLTEQPYDSEALLQRLLGEFPEILAGEDASGRQRKWLLVRREMSVPADDSGSGRWSLDHLFLDQDGIPTLVEVKRSSDTRLRREVVGQMLDYAANAVVYWPIERIEAEFEATAKAAGSDPEHLLMDVLGGDTADAYWQRVKTNLQAGKVRLVFVADVIPSELRRIVEFLNEQMDPAEVIAVEVRQFIGEGLRSLVPRVIGQTAEARAKKAASASADRWTAETFVGRVHELSGASEAAVAQRVITWAEAHGLRMWWGKGTTEATLYPMFDLDGVNQYTFAMRHVKNGFLQLQLPNMKPPFDAGAARAELVTRVENALGVRLGANPKYPGIKFALLAKDGRLQKFLDVADWIIQQTRVAVQTRRAADDGPV